MNEQSGQMDGHLSKVDERPGKVDGWLIQVDGGSGKEGRTARDKYRVAVFAAMPPGSVSYALRGRYGHSNFQRLRVLGCIASS